eukprot:gene13137-3460_t
MSDGSDVELLRMVLGSDYSPESIVNSGESDVDQKPDGVKKQYPDGVPRRSYGSFMGGGRLSAMDVEIKRLQQLKEDDRLRELLREIKSLRSSLS